MGMPQVRSRGGGRRAGWAGAGLLGWALLVAAPLAAGGNVYLTEVPDYEWYDGCFGTATGNLMGYWDRHGFPNFYTGPTAGGIAPLDSFSVNGNYGIRSLWVSKAGLDGRPADQPGHEDDYYVDYESTAPDPFVTAGRAEHTPDCIGDFIGLNQKKWQNLNGECDGNIDGYSFVYWDAAGGRRVNYTPSAAAGLPAEDIQSGLRAWTAYRGYTADTFTQLTDFNPFTPPGQGFTFADLQAEINAGYPVLLFMQDFYVNARSLPGMPRANPEIHGMLAYGYYVADDGTQYVRYRTSWASGDYEFSAWTTNDWTPEGALNLPLRGVIGYHPLPQITSVTRTNGQVAVRWDGPSSQLFDVDSGAATPLHYYVVEMATSLTPPNFSAVAAPTTDHALSLPDPGGAAAYFRLKLISPP